MLNFKKRGGERTAPCSNMYNGIFGRMCFANCNVTRKARRCRAHRSSKISQTMRAVTPSPEVPNRGEYKSQNTAMYLLRIYAQSKNANAHTLGSGFCPMPPSLQKRRAQKVTARARTHKFVIHSRTVSAKSQFVES